MRRLLPLVLLVLLLTGCEEDVVAVRGLDGQPFTLYGLLTPQLDTQWVRVFPIEDRLQPTPEAPLDARFTSEDLTTGEVRVWRDSLHRDEAGNLAHVFWAPFAAAYGHPYRLTVTRSNGQQTHVDVPVPPAVDLDPTDAEIVRTPPPRVIVIGVEAPIYVRGAAPRLHHVEVVYTVQYAPNPAATLAFSLPYADNIQENGSWIIPLSLRRDRFRLEELLAALRIDVRAYGMIVHDVRLRLMVASDAWAPPDGVFDPAVLAQPDQLWNVANGFGFVGAGYRVEQALTYPDSVLAAAGFRIVP